MEVFDILKIYNQRRIMYSAHCLVTRLALHIYVSASPRHQTGCLLACQLQGNNQRPTLACTSVGTVGSSWQQLE